MTTMSSARLLADRRIISIGRNRMPFVLQVSMLTIRNLKTTFRTPAAVIPGLIISGFFLLVYNDSLGGAASFIPGLGANSYLGFILPLSIISASLSLSLIHICELGGSKRGARHRERLLG